MMGKGEKDMQKKSNYIVSIVTYLNAKQVIISHRFILKNNILFEAVSPTAPGVETRNQELVL